MKKLETDELYQHLGTFLKSKGIELQDGSYSKRIRQGCGLLSDAINMTQSAVVRAKTGVDAKLDQMRQVIHEKTAPKAGPPPAPAPTEAASPPAAAAQSAPQASAAPPPASRPPRQKAARPRQAAKPRTRK